MHRGVGLTGEHTGWRRMREPGGYSMRSGLLVLASPRFEPTGTMTVHLDGRTNRQPLDGT